MTKEEKFVVNPLARWFNRQKAGWKIYKPRFGTAATGWDIEARRKNQDLLIEAKYIDGSFLSSAGGLITAPLLGQKVAKISFTKYLAIARQYRTQTMDRQLNERRIIAEKLIKKQLNFS